MMRLMKLNTLSRLAGVSLVALLLAACGFKIPFIDTSSDYKKAISTVVL